MIFAKTWEKVLSGEKTQTRRIKRGPYKLGHVYAVQPGRGKKAVAHIRMKRIWMQDITSFTVPRLSNEQLRAEGFKEYRDFVEVFKTANDLKHMPPFLWAFEFELVPYE